ncbi:hypothetical protein E8E15_000358 [Penicillium rubens]|nr:uncharacterized protein N7525_006428 [Penicillium rubens]KZN89627.1 hypothetical protein EN45_082410 [Penicillium chrysogenum]KAF3019037.1 hypothetical protein E8E15_000358 [Penicillium rubens]KAJ5050092.1 hypothetical protein NUH16_008622 [Penicillium rubens]KAJ5828175.1 hypothetical protein N7525_006428 [Penicillium rubens]KAJ5842071.1 hypothetical protein N7534_011901 [Penicillium rubens]
MSQTYYDFDAIQREINRISRPSAEGESVMYGVWNSILTWQFDIRNGYVTCPQDRHSLQSGSRGFSDFEVHQYVGNTRKRFLVVQCKKPGGEFGGYTWNRARVQLERYLESIHSDPQSSPTVHGIVAIGQWVRFYEYDGTMYEMEFKEAGPDQHQQHLVTDRRLIQGQLNSIRNNH